MKQAKLATNDTNVLLFYAHSNALNDLAYWKGSRKSFSTKHAKNELSNILIANQKATKGIEWYVAEEGASLLLETLKTYNGELINHKFNFNNAIAKSGELISILSNKKATLSGEFFSYYRNRSALISLVSNKAEIIEAIGKLPRAKNYDAISRRYLQESIDNISNANKDIIKSSQLHKNMATFLGALISSGRLRK